MKRTLAALALATFMIGVAGSALAQDAKPQVKKPVSTTGAKKVVVFLTTTFFAPVVETGFLTCGFASCARALPATPIMNVAKASAASVLFIPKSSNRDGL